MCDFRTTFILRKYNEQSLEQWICHTLSQLTDLSFANFAHYDVKFLIVQYIKIKNNLFWKRKFAELYYGIIIILGSLTRTLEYACDASQFIGAKTHLLISGKKMPEKEVVRGA